MLQNASAAVEAACAGCGKLFAAKRRWQRFCSDKCRSDWHRRNDKPLSQRVEELERRVAELEANAWPVR